MPKPLDGGVANCLIRVFEDSEVSPTAESIMERRLRMGTGRMEFVVYGAPAEQFQEWLKANYATTQSSNIDGGSVKVNAAFGSIGEDFFDYLTDVESAFPEVEYQAYYYESSDVGLHRLCEYEVTYKNGKRQETDLVEESRGSFNDELQQVFDAAEISDFAASTKVDWAGEFWNEEDQCCAFGETTSEFNESLIDCLPTSKYDNAKLRELGTPDLFMLYFLHYRVDHISDVSRAYLLKLENLAIEFGNEKALQVIRDR